MNNHVKRWAFHEAAHTCALIHFNRPFYKVSIEPDNKFQGRVEGAEMMNDQSKVVENIMVMLAGFSAERILGINAYLDLSEGGDGFHAARMISTISPQQAGEIYRSLQSSSDTLVKALWPKVERLADALLMHGTLTEHQVKTILR